MLRSTILALICLFVTGCVALPDKGAVLASLDATQPTEEMECMSDCLQDFAETCENCAARCIR